MIMNLFKTTLFFSLSCLVSQAFAQDAMVEHGNEVYLHWCAPCHDDGPRRAGTLALQFVYKGERPAVLDERTDLLPEYTKLIVRNGISIMSPFRKTEINDEELDALAAYLARNNN